VRISFIKAIYKVHFPLKKTVFYIILLCCPLLSFAQKEKVKNNPAYDDKPLHFGFSFGLNTMDFSMGRNYLSKPNDTLFADVSNMVPGFQVNIVSDARLGEYFNLRFMPGIVFGQRDISFYGPNNIKWQVTKLESSFIDFPLSIKYKAKRLNNYRPYLISGFNVRYDLAARNKFKENSQDYVMLKALDYYYEIGFGIDYYLLYFKFSTELKFSLGMRDIFNPIQEPNHPEYARSIDHLTSQMVLLSFHFE